MANTVIKVWLAEAGEVDRMWPLVTPGFDAASRKVGADIGVDYLWSECRSGRAFLILIARDDGVLGASVWRFEKWTTGRKLHCLGFYGHDMADWLELHTERVKELARMGGVSVLVAEGRIGFQRVLPKARVLRQLYEVDI